MKNARKKQIVNPSKKTTALEKPKKYRRNSRQSSKKSMIRECEQIQSIILPFIALSATICGAESYRDFEAFGKAQFKWLKEFFPLKHGIPSHDTFCRVFNLLEPKSFEKAYRLFIESLKIRTTKHIAVDGKASRGCYNIKGQCLLRGVNVGRGVSYILR